MTETLHSYGGQVYLLCASNWHIAVTVNDYTLLVTSLLYAHVLRIGSDQFIRQDHDSAMAA
jgi:hypothetical protein